MVDLEFRLALDLGPGRRPEGSARRVDFDCRQT